MRIAFLVGVFPRISETFVLNQITGLLALGHEVDVFPGKQGPMEKLHPAFQSLRLLDRTEFPPAPFHPRSLRAALRYPAAFRVSRKLGRGGSVSRLLPALAVCPRPRSYDIIHAHFGGQGIKAIGLRELGAMTGRVVTTFYGQDATSYPRQHGRDCYRELFAQGDRFIAISQHLLGRIQALGCPVERAECLPIGVAPADFPFHPRRWQPPEPLRLLTVARLEEKKGLEYAIRAVARVIPDFPQVEYHILGEGSRRKMLEKLVADLRVETRVRLPGAASQEQVRDACRQSHVFLLPSVTAVSGDEEGQGLVLTEAQCSGMPVLATRHNGFPETIRDGQSGFLVPERDVEALEERLRYLLTHPAIWPDMGRAGRAWVEEKFDNARLAVALVELYQRILRDDFAANRPGVTPLQPRSACLAPGAGICLPPP